jgi:hypothetical protein
MLRFYPLISSRERERERERLKGGLKKREEKVTFRASLTKKLHGYLKIKN